MAGLSSQIEWVHVSYRFLGEILRKWHTREDSNSGLRIRSPTLYPAELRVLAGGPV